MMKSVFISCIVLLLQFSPVSAFADDGDDAVASDVTAYIHEADSLKAVLAATMTQLTEEQSVSQRLNTQSSLMKPYALNGLRVAVAGIERDFETFSRDDLNSIVAVCRAVGNGDDEWISIADYCRTLARASDLWSVTNNYIVDKQWMPAKCDSLANAVADLTATGRLSPDISVYMDSLNTRLSDMKLSMLLIEPVVSSLSNNREIIDLTNAKNPNSQMIMDEIANLVNSDETIKGRVERIKSFNAPAAKFDSLINMLVNCQRDELDVGLQNLIDEL